MTRAVLCRAMLCCAAAGMVGMHACSVGPPWQADHPRISVLHLYAHVATNFHGLQATFDRSTLAGLPLERLAYFRPPLGNRGAVTVEDFIADPDMSCMYVRRWLPTLRHSYLPHLIIVLYIRIRRPEDQPALIVCAGGHEGVGKGSGSRGEDGVVVQLLSLEAMRSRGSLSEEEFEGAKKLLLREGKAACL